MQFDAQNNDFISSDTDALDGGAKIVTTTKNVLPRRNKIGEASTSTPTKLSSPSHTELPDAISRLAPSTHKRRATQIQEATDALQTTVSAPPEPNSRKGRKAMKTAQPSFRPPCDNLPPASVALETTVEAQAATEFSGHLACDAQGSLAAKPHADQRQNWKENQYSSALIGDLIEQHRYRWQMIRARQRLELQGQAFCRSFVDGDKTAAAKLWNEVRKDPAHEMRIWLEPFMAAMEPLLQAQHETEKVLAKMAKKLPVYDWARSVSGFGDVSLSAVIGELGCAPTEYKSVSAIWKRMGLAVINGGRQRKVSGAEALDHGYNSERRAIMWNIGLSLLRRQVRNEKDENGKNVEGTGYAIGDFGQLYLDHKASLNARNEAGDFAEVAEAAVNSAKARGSKPNAHNLEGRLSPSHIHNRAQRYIEKRLLRELWRAWRRAMIETQTTSALPASETILEG